MTGPIPLLAISSVFKELFGRALPSPYRHLGVSRWQGCRESNPVLGGVGDRSATGASPLWCVLSCVSGPKNKGAASFRKRLLDGPRPSKVQVTRSRAPPWRGWPVPWLEWRTRVVTRTSSSATSPGFVPRRNAGYSGS